MIKEFDVKTPLEGIMMCSKEKNLSKQTEDTAFQGIQDLATWDDIIAVRKDKLEVKELNMVPTEYEARMLKKYKGRYKGSSYRSNKSSHSRSSQGSSRNNS